MDITEEEWALYVLDSPLFMELLEDDVELLQRILTPNETEEK
jgi:hypothetical protein